jgi:hypothetical protein
MSQNLNRRAGHVVVLRFLVEKVTFEAFDEGVPGGTGALPVSAEVVASRYFRSEVPSEAEVEDAINAIEDRIMENPGLRTPGAWLVTDDPRLGSLLGQQFPQPRVSRDEVEGLFTRYALQSMGRSSVYDTLTVDKLDYALLLIVREILHHYDFEGIEVVPPA